MFNANDERAIRDLAVAIGTKTPSQAQLATLINYAATMSFADFCKELKAFADRGKLTGRTDQETKNQALCQQFKELACRFHDENEDEPEKVNLLKQNQTKRAGALRYVSRLRGWKFDDQSRQRVQNASGGSTFTADDERAIRNLARELRNPKTPPSQALLRNLINLATTGSIYDLRLELDSIANKGKFTGQEYQKTENHGRSKQFKDLIFRFYNAEENEPEHIELYAQNQSKRARALRYVTRLRGGEFHDDERRRPRSASRGPIFTADDESAIRNLAAKIGAPRKSPSQSLLGNLINLAVTRSIIDLCLELDSLANQGKFTGHIWQKKRKSIPLPAVQRSDASIL